MKRKILSKKIEREIRKIISRFLSPKEYQIFIFGSRANNRAENFSDYDVGIWGKKPVAGHILVEIEEVLEESDLPFRVDVVDFSLVSPDFRKVALSKIKKL